MKPSSISNAWRQGTTPVQKKQQLVSIEKLLATNQLNSVLRGITPAKSPVLPRQTFTELKPLERSETAEDLTELEELSKGIKNTLGDTKVSVLSMELIRVRPCDYYTVALVSWVDYSVASTLKGRHKLQIESCGLEFNNFILIY